MEIIGKIIKIYDEVQVTASFKKRQLVITTAEQYPQFILIEFAQDKCDLLNKYQINETVKVSINLRGREWINPQGITQYFNQIQGWKIEAQNASLTTPSTPEQTYNAQPFDDGEEYEDLPF